MSSCPDGPICFTNGVSRPSHWPQDELRGFYRLQGFWDTVRDSIDGQRWVNRFMEKLMCEAAVVWQGMSLQTQSHRVCERVCVCASLCKLVCLCVCWSLKQLGGIWSSVSVSISTMMFFFILHDVMSLNITVLQLIQYNCVKKSQLLRIITYKQKGLLVLQ